MQFLEAINSIIWHDYVLFAVLGTGIIFTVWSRFCQYRALTRGVTLIWRGEDGSGGAGAISHFQALSTALSATVGLGNIAGVAIGVSLGGPGAVFWMWVTGLIGMALKTAEVTQSMLYRNIDNPDDPEGGPMWVASRGFARLSPHLATVGRVVAAIFCVTLIVSTITGGNMFQAWNVADITWSYFGVPRMLSGAIMFVLVALVIIGGIRRIGAAAGFLVPFMCVTYLIAGILVLILEADQVPAMLRQIVASAFSPSEAQGAFLGGAAGWAFLKGMQRSLFSNEAGQGSSPIAHSAVRTAKPVSEGVVAGLEPFIDTIVVCTITALVILISGVWEREPALRFTVEPQVVEVADGSWTLQSVELLPDNGLTVSHDEVVFAIVRAGANEQTGNDLHRLYGTVSLEGDGTLQTEWDVLESDVRPRLMFDGAYLDYKGATLTARAFDRIVSGLGILLVPFTAWLFAISTMISWSYYGEQGVRYLTGGKAVTLYRMGYCGLILVSTSPLVRTETQLDSLSTLGTGLMLITNLPLILIFGNQAMKAYRNYFVELAKRKKNRTAP